MKHFYICYSHTDKAHFLRLKQRLDFFAKRDRLTYWSQESLLPGEVILRGIESNLAKADVVLMLVSSDFFDMEGVREKEYQLAVQRGAAGLALIVPVVLRSTYGWQESEIGIYPPAKEGKPITLAPDVDEAWSEVIVWIEQVFKVVDERNATTQPPTAHPQEMLIKIATNVESLLAGQQRMEDGLQLLITLTTSQQAEVDQVLHWVHENRFSEDQMIQSLQLIDQLVRDHASALSVQVKEGFEALKTKDLEVQKRFKLSIPIIPIILSYEMDINDNSKREKVNGFWKGLKAGRVLL